MMNDSFLDCECTDDVVAYMYGELTAAEASSFESHLLSCSVCTDEFAEISNARYEVYEWKKLEFDLLPTPAVEIPVRSEPAAVGFIEKARIAFGGWAVPSVAFAGLTIAVLAGGLVVSNNTGSDVAAVNSNEVPRPARPATLEPVVQNPADTSRRADVGPTQAAAPLQKAAASDQTLRRTVKATKVAAPRIGEVKQASARNQPVNTRAGRNQARSAPTLNDFVDDEEDTSLRLAQLFDDIDTRD